MDKKSVDTPISSVLRLFTYAICSGINERSEMLCPQCKSENLKVLEKRDIEGEAIRRRRECNNCTFRFTTYERIETPGLVVIKKDGHKEVFSREKMSVGIYKALEKRPVSQPDVEEFIERIEKLLRSTAECEIPSAKIGEIILNNLRDIDEVAYVRFASVYKDFTDIESFASELKVLQKGKEN